MPGKQDIEAQIPRLLQDMQQRVIIQQAISIDKFLNPEAEEIYNIAQTVEEITQDVLQLLNPQPDYKSDEQEEAFPLITPSRALEALETLKSYKEQQEDGSATFFEALYQHQDAVKQRKEDKRQQKLITNWFT